MILTFENTIFSLFIYSMVSYLFGFHLLLLTLSLGRNKTEHQSRRPPSGAAGLPRALFSGVSGASSGAQASLTRPPLVTPIYLFFLS